MKHQKSILTIAWISIATLWGEVSTINHTNNSIKGDEVWSDTIHVRATVTVQPGIFLEIQPGTKEFSLINKSFNISACSSVHSFVLFAFKF